MDEHVFDLFSGTSEKDAVWLESVDGLTNARQRLERIALNVPGAYFLYSSRSHSILAKTNTSKKLLSFIYVKKAGAA